MNYSRPCVFLLLSILIFSTTSCFSLANENDIYNNTTVNNSITSPLDTRKNVISENTMHDEDYLVLANQNLDRSLNLLNSILNSITILLALIGLAIAGFSGIAVYIINNYRNKFKQIKNEAEDLIKDAQTKHEELSNIVVSAKEMYESVSDSVGDIPFQEEPTEEILKKANELNSSAYLADFVELLGAKLDYNDYLKIGSSNYYKKNYKKALEAFDKANTIKPNDAQTLFNKGVILSEVGRNEEALEAYDKANAIKPDHANAWYNKGIVLRKLGRSEEALEAYDKAIAIEPDHAAAWSNKSNILSELGRNEEALEAFDKAIAIEPDHAAAWSNKGIVLSELGRNEEALEAYDKAIAIEPDHAAAWSNKGIVLSELGRSEEALEAYDKAIAIEPDGASAWYNKACNYAVNKLNEKAIYHLKKAIELDPTSKEKAKTDKDFDNIKDDNEFSDLVFDK